MPLWLVLGMASKPVEMIESLIVCSMKQLQAHREAANSQLSLIKLPAEIRNRIYERLVPSNKWLTAYNRSSPTEIALLQVCRSIRADTVPMYYGNNTFALDLRTSEHRFLAYAWINSLSVEAVNSLRKLRISVEIECDCEAAASAKAKKGYKWYQGKDAFLDGVSFTISINRSCEEEPFGISMGFCKHCEDRPVELAAQADRFLETMELEVDSSVVTREDLLTVLNILKPLSDMELEE